MLVIIFHEITGPANTTKPEVLLHPVPPKQESPAAQQLFSASLVQFTATPAGRAVGRTTPWMGTFAARSRSKVLTTELLTMLLANAQWQLLVMWGRIQGDH